MMSGNFTDFNSQVLENPSKEYRRGSTDPALSVGLELSMDPSDRKD